MCDVFSGRHERMYIKVTKNKAGQSYYHVVESYWKDGRSRQRTLLSLGRAGDGKLESLASAIARHQQMFTALDLANEIAVEDSYILGPLCVLERMFERTGIDKVLGEVQSRHPKLGFELRKLVFTMVAARFVQPSSKLKVYEHGQKRLYPGMVQGDIALHSLYRCLDVLAKEKERIEQGLFWHGRDLLHLEVDVVLYDLTTLRFESTREDLGELRKLGYSKERRSDLTQVVLGLLVDPEGIPLGFEVYPGNTYEGHTLSDIVTKMKTKFRIRRFILVADRGLLSRANLTTLRESGQDSEFIVGMKLGVFKERHEEFYDKRRYRFLDTEGELAIYETEHEGDRCVIIWSKQRAERDRTVREAVLEKIRKKLLSKKVTAKTFVSNKTYQRYVQGLGGKGPFTLNESAIVEDEQRDGFFGVLSNITDMSAEQLVRQYKQLWIVEDAFGELKGTLKSRPVFHWTDPRIIGHLLVCFVAYLCEAHLTRALRAKALHLESPAIEQGIIASRPLTVVEAMRELTEVRAIPVTIRSTTLWVRTDITGNAAKLFSAIGLKPPGKVLNLSDLRNPAGTRPPCDHNSPELHSF